MSDLTHTCHICDVSCLIHVAHMQNSRHVHDSDMSSQTWLTHMRNMSDLCVRRVFFLYGMATVSRIDEIIGLFCRISSLLKVSFVKETYNFIDATNQSHPIWRMHTYEELTYAHTYIHTHTHTYIGVIHVWDANSLYVQHGSFDSSRLHRTYSTQYTHNTHSLPLSPPSTAPSDYIILTARTCSAMGWLQLVGSLKTWFSFAKEPYKRDYILQKRHVFWRSILIIATPNLEHGLVVLWGGYHQ